MYGKENQKANWENEPSFPSSGSDQFWGGGGCWSQVDNPSHDRLPKFKSKERMMTDLLCPINGPLMDLLPMTT